MKTRVTLLLVLTAMTTACIHKQAGPVTAWERVNVNMAAMAAATFWSSGAAARSHISCFGNPEPSGNPASAISCFAVATS